MLKQMKFKKKKGQHLELLWLERRVGEDDQ